MTDFSFDATEVFSLYENLTSGRPRGAPFGVSCFTHQNSFQSFDSGIYYDVSLKLKPESGIVYQLRTLTASVYGFFNPDPTDVNQQGFDLDRSCGGIFIYYPTVASSGIVSPVPFITQLTSQTVFNYTAPGVNKGSGVYFTIPYHEGNVEFFEASTNDPIIRISTPGGDWASGNPGSGGQMVLRIWAAMDCFYKEEAYQSILRYRIPTI